jgi:hypothetical protein
MTQVGLCSLHMLTSTFLSKVRADTMSLITLLCKHAVLLVPVTRSILDAQFGCDGFLGRSVRASYTKRLTQLIYTS